ncbi:hypothetical protein K438DRAFT_1764326 [Mycena galopus ATCC 62051]|nr:hypothetical protein K438DRAFT_1764326 [Mycena galopus ATCC 62051]
MQNFEKEKKHNEEKACLKGTTKFGSTNSGRKDGNELLGLREGRDPESGAGGEAKIGLEKSPEDCDDEDIEPKTKAFSGADSKMECSGSERGATVQLPREA